MYTMLIIPSRLALTKPCLRFLGTPLSWHYAVPREHGLCVAFLGMNHFGLFHAKPQSLLRPQLQ